MLNLKPCWTPSAIPFQNISKPVELRNQTSASSGQQQQNSTTTLSSFAVVNCNCYFVIFLFIYSHLFSILVRCFCRCWLFHGSTASMRSSSSGTRAGFRALCDLAKPKHEPLGPSATKVQGPKAPGVIQQLVQVLGTSLIIQWNRGLLIIWSTTIIKFSHSKPVVSPWYPMLIPTSNPKKTARKPKKIPEKPSKTHGFSMFLQDSHGLSKQQSPRSHLWRRLRQQFPQGWHHHTLRNMTWATAKRFLGIDQWLIPKFDPGTFMGKIDDQIWSTTPEMG